MGVCARVMRWDRGGEGSGCSFSRSESDMELLGERVEIELGVDEEEYFLLLWSRV